MPDPAGIFPPGSGVYRESMEKYCKKCDTTKPVSEFNKNASSKDGLGFYCRQCARQTTKEWYKENKEARSEYYVVNKERYKKYYETNKERVKENVAAWQEKNPHYQIQHRYGLSQAAYNKLLEDQDYACAICGGDNNGKTLVVDHDHSCCKGGNSCGKCVRQLLCSSCNFMLGNAKDNIEILEAAKKYLERHSRSKNLAKNLD